MQMTPWERIDNELNRRKLGWQWVANGLNFDIQRVHNWKARGIPATHFRAIAELFGATVDWLEGIEEQIKTAEKAYSPYVRDHHVAEQPRATYNVTPIDLQARVPVISWVQAGEFCDAADPYPAGFAEDWIDCPEKHSPRTFAVKVRGLSMYNPAGKPSFSEGDVIFCDPDRQAENKSLVICRLDDQPEATFKRLLIEDGIKMLEALNPSWPQRIIKINGNATVCGVVFGRYDSF